MKKTQQKKNKYPLLFGVLFILLGSTILFIPLLNTFTNNDAIGLPTYALVNFLSYLFITMTFIELLFTRLVMLGANPYLMVLIAVSTALVALTLDYLAGYFLSKTLLTKFFSEKKIDKYKKKLEKYGNYVIFAFNFLPLSSPLLTLAGGLIRYKYKKIMLYSFLGLATKYILIAVIITMFYV
jgi:membrane protein DedA with SNARE-associated domain